MEQKMYLFGNFVHSEAEGSSFVIWRRVMWSFWFAYLGVHPTVDHITKQPFSKGSWDAKQANQKLADGFFLVIWSIKCDLDHLAKGFGLEHYSSNKPCCLCPCEAGQDAEPTMKCNLFTSAARWMSMIYTHDLWRSLNPDPHYLFQIPYMSAINYDPDELHVMHLGTSMYFLGSILWLLVFEILGGDPKAAMKAVWQMIANQYARLQPQCQFTNLSIDSFTSMKKWDKVYPKLKGKGAEVKDLMEPMHQIWLAHKRHCFFQSWFCSFSFCLFLKKICGILIFSYTGLGMFKMILS